MKKWLTIIFTVMLVLVIDQVTKHYLFKVEYFNLIPNVISVSTNGGNSGAAYGILSGKTMTLIIVSSIMIVALLIYNYFSKENHMLYFISFGFILGGAIGNLIDRIWLKYVRDFIFLDFYPSFPIFNMADSFLCVGAVMLAVYILFFAGKKKSEK
ncbi:MAG: signal peptidase II [Clostridiales bacterium]|nr:signal peptidase II [Clostridiales bacterium]